MNPTNFLTFDGIRDEVRKMVIRRGFENETTEDKLLFLVSEVGEISEALAIRKGLAYSNDKKPTSPKKEIVDAFLLILMMAELEGMDLFNETYNVLQEEKGRQYVKGDF